MISLLYGSHGLGKTSIAAGAPYPIFIQTEDGLAHLENDTFGVLRSYREVKEAIASLRTDKHDFQTAVLDSAGWLEPLIWEQACVDNSWRDIDAPGYGKGQRAALTYWREILSDLVALRNERGMGVLILAHAAIETVKHPELEDFDRFYPKLHKDATALIQELVENVLFLDTYVSTTKIDPRDKNSRMKGAGGAQRYIYTKERPSHMAKNRWNMPEKIMIPDGSGNIEDVPYISFCAIAQHIPYYKALMNSALPEQPGLREQSVQSVGEDLSQENTTESQDAA